MPGCCVIRAREKRVQRGRLELPLPGKRFRRICSFAVYLSTSFERMQIYWVRENTLVDLAEHLATGELLPRRLRSAMTSLPPLGKKSQARVRNIACFENWQ